jgi:hypothetical protein
MEWAQTRTLSACWRFIVRPYQGVKPSASTMNVGGLVKPGPTSPEPKGISEFAR